LIKKILFSRCILSDHPKIYQKSKVIEKIEIQKEIFGLAWELFQTYEDKKLSFTDCTSFALMKKKGIEKVFSFDEDFARLEFILIP
jgi:uncharacterized protein